VVGDRVFEEVEPEEGELSEDLAFVGNSTGQNMVEGRDSIAGDEEKLIAGESVDVADLAASGEGKGAEISLEKSCWHHVDGTTSVFGKETSSLGSAKRQKFIEDFCGLRGPARTAAEDGSGSGTRHGKGGA